jgi:hypothetical protein
MVCDAKIYPPKPCRRVNNPSYQLAIVPDSGCWPLIFSDAIVIQGRGLLLHGIVSSGLATMGGNVLLQVSRCTQIAESVCEVRETALKSVLPHFRCK